MPEIHIWHGGKESRVGQVDMIARHGHFVLAVGRFDSTHKGRAAQAYYKSRAIQHVTGVSHGFVYPVSEYRDGVFWTFNTYEVSLLPRGAAANPFTAIAERNHDMDQKKAAYLRAVFGDEQASAILESLEQGGKAIEELGVAFKSFDQASSGSADEQAVADASDKLVNIIPDLIAANAQSLKASADLAKALQSALDRVAAAEARLKSLEEMMSDRPRSALTSPEGITTGQAPMEQALKNEVPLELQKLFNPYA